MSQFDPNIGNNPLFTQRNHPLSKADNNVNSKIPAGTDSISQAKTDTVSINNQALFGMKFVFQSVSQRFSSTNLSQSSPIGFDADKALEKVASNNIFDFEKVAETIMDFVSSSVLAAQSRGASTTELEDMLQQARSGVNQGIDEALAELEDSSLLNESLSEGIEKSRELIAKQIDDLAQKLFPANNSFDIEQQVNPVASYASDLLTSSESSSDLTIRTNDGDLVTISFSEYREKQSSERYSRSSDDDSNQTSYQLTTSSYREINFSYSIEGELDDNEKAAISALIEDVNSLQKEFFNGDINKAFEQALTLGFDESQLSSISLDLQQKQTSYVSQTYNEVASFNDNQNEALKNQLKPVLDFVEQFKQLRDKADEILENDKQAFSELLTSVFKAEYGNNDSLLNQFDNFIGKLD